MVAPPCGDHDRKESTGVAAATRQQRELLKALAG
jgi:hypothetical protein